MELIQGTNQSAVLIHDTSATNDYRLLRKFDLNTANWSLERQVPGQEGTTTTIIPTNYHPSAFFQAQKVPSTTNGALVLQLSATSLDYLLGSPPVFLDRQVSVISPVASFDRGQLTVSFATNGDPEDVLFIQHQGTGAGQIGVFGNRVTMAGVPFATFFGGTNLASLQILFNSAATPTFVTGLLRQLSFRNDSLRYSRLPRTLRFDLTDGQGVRSMPAFKVVNVNCPEGIDLMVVIDVSFSLTPQGFADMKQTATNFINYLDPAMDRVGLVTIYGSSAIVDRLTNNFSKVRQDLIALTNRSGTIIHPAISNAQSVLVSMPRTNALRLMLLLSDGQVNPRSSESNSIAAANLAKAAGTRIIAAGFINDGGLVFNDFMRQLASSPADYYPPDPASNAPPVHIQLDAQLRAAARSICRLPNAPPVAQSRLVAVNEDTSTNFVLTAVDPDGDALSYTILTTPSHGALQGAAPQVTYTPAPGFHGMDSFTFKVDDGLVDSPPATVSINVISVNDRPIAFAQSMTNSGAAPFPITLAGFDLDGDGLTFQVIVLPTNGTLNRVTGSLSGQTNHLVYTPLAAGTTDHFEFLVNDGQLSSAPAHVSIRLLTSECLLTAGEWQKLVSTAPEDLQPGSMTVSNCVLELSEGNSFVVSAARQFMPPSTPSVLRFTYSVDFDRTTTNAIKDAFEVALLDAEGSSLVHPADIGLDAFLNASDLQTVLATSGATVLSQGLGTNTVALPLPPGVLAPFARLTFRLVNNDRDASTRVRISRLDIDSYNGDVGSPTNLVGNVLTPQSSVDFATLSDISGSVGVNYGVTSFNEKARRLYAEASLQNLGTYEFGGPVVVFVRNISTPSVQVLDPDGFGPDGAAYFLFGTPGNGVLPPGTSTPLRMLSFFNPQRSQFTFELAVAGKLNRSPSINSAPLNGAIAGRPYHYQAEASDPDDDPLEFSLLAAPVGMSINPFTGAIEWTPDVNDIASHTVVLEVRDGKGGVGSQVFALGVTTAPPNRPPLFVSTPVTSAVVSTNTSAGSGLVDLSRWTALQYTNAGHPATNGGPFQGPANWILSPGFSNVTQTLNADPSIFLSDFRLESDEISGTWRAGADPDDDYMGFVFGFQDTNHFYLFDWKQRTQTNSLCGVALQGMNVKVINASGVPTCAEFWPTYGTTGTMTNLYHNSVTWQTNRDYNFNLRFFPGFFTINVRDGTNVLAAISISDSTYSSGNFGFYNNSQGQIRYSGFTRRPLPFPTYAYPSLAHDPDGDVVSYSLVQAPANMSISSVDGLISWGPGIDQLGEHQVTVQADDARGGVARQTFVVRVLPMPGNRPPQMLSLPPAFSPVLTPGCISLPTGLAHWWPADGNALDLAAGASGILSNGVSVVLGRIGTAFSFDGLNDTMLPGMPPSTITNNFTIEFWAWPTQSRASTLEASAGVTGLTGQRYAVAPEHGGAASAGVGVSVGTNGVGVFEHGDNYLPSLLVHNAAIQGWTHVALVYTNRRPQLFVNGAFVRSGLIGPRATVFPSKIFGTLNGVNGFAGLLDEIRIYNRVLSGSEIALLANPTASPCFPYLYQMVGADPDGDKLTYRLAAAPEGAMVNTNSGLLIWPPQPGEARFEASVEDPFRASDVQTFTLRVAVPRTNHVLGTVFDDADGDGQRAMNGSEPGAAGWNVFIDLDSNGRRDFAEPFTATSALGTYAFSNLSSGTFTLLLEPKVGWRSTAPLSPHSLSLPGGLTITGVDYGVQNYAAETNRPPRFTTVPITNVVAGSFYRYQAVAVDLDLETPSYDLTLAPAGMNIETNSGLIRWSPGLPDVGTHSIVLRARDVRDGVTLQTFQVQVLAPNTAPFITSEPFAPARVGIPYEYLIRAQDGENDSLTFRRVQGPSNLVVNASNGLLTWTPLPSQTGTQVIAVAVSDGRGGEAVQSWSLPVVISGTNRPPEITSVPRQGILIGLPYFYLVEATDPDGDPLRFALVSAPNGMTVTNSPFSLATTNLVVWTPSTDQAGLHRVEVRVEDGRGGFSNQAFDLAVNTQVANPGTPTAPPANQRPRITSLPTIGATLGTLYSYNPQAQDPDGDAIAWSLPIAPDGASIDPLNGAIRWIPGADQSGLQHFTLRADDGRGDFDQQVYSVDVSGSLSNRPPQFFSQPVTTATAATAFNVQTNALDFRSWTVLQYTNAGHPSVSNGPFQGPATWIISSDGTTVQQTRNADPSILLSDFALESGEININWIAGSDPDDDYMGFVFGFQDTNHFYLFDWKQADQTNVSCGLALRGMNVKVVQGNGVLSCAEFWPTFGVGSTMTNLYHNSIPWRTNQTYRFNLRFFPGLFAITVREGTNILASISIADSTYVNGRFGLYNNSQGLITYSGSTRTTLPLPTYSYPAIALDPDEDPLTYSLLDGPENMTVSAGDGLIKWAPSAAQIGTNAVTIQAADGRGGVATQSFAVVVTAEPLSSNGPPPLTNAPPAYLNRPPVITSTPRTGATVGSSYAYYPEATDPDRDLIFWSLTQAPVGASIDPYNGALRWVPTSAQVGSHRLILRVDDGRGGSATQEISVHVYSANQSPQITSIPPTVASTNRLYAYEVKAADPDGDSLRYLLTAGPTNMTINASNGLVQWVPRSNQMGSNFVAIEVRDSSGGMASQSFAVLVGTNANLHPIVTSIPPFVAVVNRDYEYRILATDPNGDELEYLLVESPTGMVLQGNVLYWRPSLSQTGLAFATIIVLDPFGGFWAQGWSIGVRSDNRPPVITSVAPNTALAGSPYQYAVRATDPDNDRLTYGVTGPQGMTIDSLGRLLWSPVAANVGTNRVTVTATDSRGARATQVYDLLVRLDSQPPQLQLSVSENPVNVSNQVTFAVSSVDNVRVASLNLTVGGIPVALDAFGRASRQMTVAGRFPAVATATDSSGNSSTSILEIIVRVLDDGTGPQVNIASPAEGSIITAPVAITGSVTDNNLLYYSLSVAPSAGSEFREIARGSNTVNDGVLGWFDPTTLPNDSYLLRLEAEDASGSIATIEREISAAGELKLGNFRLSFTDLSIPVAGIPITVARTYDSLLAGEKGDFGYGWRLEFRNTQLRASVPKSSLQEQLIYNPFRNKSRVYITLPGGKREGFTFKPRPNAVAFLRISYPEFVADAGTYSKLTVPEVPLFLDPTTGEYVDWNLGTPYNPASPIYGDGAYTLTTKEGVKMQIDGNTGSLKTITDRNTNVLTFTEAGIVSSAGASITFTRDPQGRIVGVTDPMGHTIRYAYNSAGDLVTVTDRTTNTTRFVYHGSRPHYLEKIIDPLGRTGVRTEYDDAGRLVKMFDAKSNAVEMVHNAAANEEQVVDALGHVTSYFYDDRGNVTNEVNALGAVTRRTFDANNNTTSETDSLGNTTAYEYDADGNVTKTTDPLGAVTRTVSDRFGQIASVTDPLGRTTRYEYDARGNLLSSIDPAGNASRTTYDAAGNPTSTTDALGNVTRMETDSGCLCRVKSQTDALGNKTTFEYDANGNQLSSTSTLTSNGVTHVLVTRREYDSAGRVTAVIDPLGNVARTEFESAGQRTATVDALGRRTEYRFDERGQIAETLFADGTRSRLNYDEAGRLVGSTDRAGRETRRVLDALGRVIETILPDSTPGDPSDNPRVRIEYDPLGRTVAQIDERGNRTSFAVDAGGRTVAVTNALGHVTRTVYDEAGQRVAEVDALGHTNGFVYDALGRRVQALFADGTTNRTVYDALGRVAVEVDQAGVRTAFGHDALGRLTSVTNALGTSNQTVTVYAYNETGNLVRQQDALNRVTCYEYDGLGRRVANVLPLGQRSGTLYDPAGNILAATNFNGQVITYEYDVNHRLAAKHLPDGTTVEYAYTPTGQRSQVAMSNAAQSISNVWSFSYDSRDRLIRRIDPDGRAVAYAYDAAGNRTILRTGAAAFPLPLGGGEGQGEGALSTTNSITRFTFDALNRLEAVIDSDGGTNRYFYDPANNIQFVALPNGTFRTNSYDMLNRVTNIAHVGPAGVFASFRYTLGPAGHRTQVVEHNGRTVQYAYDSLYRLTQERITDPETENRTMTYSMDSVGNRLARVDSVEGTTSYTYDSNDQLLTETLNGITTRYGYDANGNTLSRSNATELTHYFWSSENRLIRAIITTNTQPSTSKTVDYAYDDDGIRVAAIVDGEETRYLIDGNRSYAQVMEEYAPNGAVAVDYVHAMHHVISLNRTTNRSYFHSDHLGSTRALTNPNGGVTRRYIFDAYGRGLGQISPAQTAYLYAGEQRDSRLGFDYLRSRYLFVANGRFAGRDTAEGAITRPQSLHRYTYAESNPVDLTDPSGQSAALAALMVPATVFEISVQIVPVLIRGSMVTLAVNSGMGPPLRQRDFALALIADGYNEGFQLYLDANRQLAFVTTQTGIMINRFDKYWKIASLTADAFKTIRAFYRAPIAISSRGQIKVREIPTQFFADLEKGILYAKEFEQIRTPVHMPELVRAWDVFASETLKWALKLLANKKELEDRVKELTH